MRIVNALTIDVEDYYHVTNFERDINRDDWPSYESRVVESTRKILRLLDRYHIKATFFVLGYVAQAAPRTGPGNRRGGARDRLAHVLAPHALSHDA